MTIPTAPIGSIPRPLALIEAVATRDGTAPALDPLYEEAVRETIERFEATGSPVIADVDYSELLPSLFELKVGNFYIAPAGESGSRPRLEDHPKVHERGSADFYRRRRTDRPAH